MSQEVWTILTVLLSMPLDLLPRFMADEESPDGRRRETEQREDRARNEEGLEEPVERVAASTVRAGLLVLGAFVLLFAIGQIIGFDVLAMLSEALDTREARWSIVAIFGIILITIALRGFGVRS